MHKYTSKLLYIKTFSHFACFNAYYLFRRERELN